MVSHRNSVWPDAPSAHTSSKGSEQEKRKRLSRWWSYDRFVDILVYGNDSRVHVYIGSASPARRGMHFRMPLCTRICHVRHTRAQLSPKRNESIFFHYILENIWRIYMKYYEWILYSLEIILFFVIISMNSSVTNKTSFIIKATNWKESK